MFSFIGASSEERKKRKLLEKLDKAQQKGRFKNGLEILSELIKLERKNPRWHQKRGDFLRRLGDQTSAIDAYDRAVILYADLGMVVRAIAIAKTIVAMDPDRIDALERVDPQAARLLHRKERPLAMREDPREPEGRVSIFEEAIDLKPAPDAQPDETRFGESNERVSIEISLSDVELVQRVSLVPPRISASEEPPSAGQLAKLPLFPLFAEVPKDALTEIARQSELVELGDGEYVIRNGDPADALFGIVEGGVRVLVPGLAEGARVTLAEGDVFGESCLLKNEPRKADVVVQGQLVALRISKQVLDRLVADYPRIGELLLEMLARRLLANLLHGSPLFMELDSAAKQDLARAFEVNRVAAGIKLLERGKKSDGLYINLTGKVEITERDGAPGEKAGPGTMFGQNSLISRAPSQTTVRSLTDMVVLRLSTAAFSKVAMQYPAMLANIAECPAFVHLST